MSLREDSDFYCLIWLGFATLAAYYFSFIYLWLNGRITLSIMTATLLPVLVLPPLLVFVFVGYLKPVRGKVKLTMFALSVVLSLFFVIFSYAVPSEWGGGLGMAVWGIGSALLTAGGFSIIPPLEESISPGLLDVSHLPYVRKVEETPSEGVTEESKGAESKQSEPGGPTDSTKSTESD